MPNVATARRSTASSRARAASRPKPALVPIAALSAPSGEKPVRGVKLKTVSTFTLIFALLCVLAFAAGRPPASAEGARARQGLERGARVSRNARHRTQPARSAHARHAAAHAVTEE